MLCVNCLKPNSNGKRNCDACLEKRRKKKAEHAAKGGCTYLGCSSPRSGGTKTCKLHREYYRERNRVKYEKEKQQRRDRKLATMSFAKLLQDFDAVL